MCRWYESDMWQGDSLTVIFGLAGFAVASLIGALTAPDGWKPKALWAATALFTLLLGTWIAAPALGPTVQAAKPVLGSLIQSGALMMIGTVVVVALIVKKQRPPNPNGPHSPKLPASTSNPPVFAAEQRSRWSPEYSFSEGLAYYGADAKQAGYYDKPEDVVRRLLSALRESKITAWGRAHPSEEEFQISPSFWYDNDVTLETNYVFSGNLNCGAYGVRLSKAEMETVWPPKVR